MGSLENARELAHTVGETIVKVQGPMDVHLMVPHITTKFDELKKHGPHDLWWEGVEVLYRDCLAQAPQKCNTLAEYAQWAEHMALFWHTVLSAREMLVAWAGVDPSRPTMDITPDADLIRVRNLYPVSDFPKGQDAPIAAVGKETLEALEKRGISCFDAWTPAQYRTKLSMASTRQQAKVLFHRSEPGTICGFYAWRERPADPPPSAMPKARTIGEETLRTRTLWAKETFPERVGFRKVWPQSLTSINECEAALRIALDLMKISATAKAPLVLPEKKIQP